MKLLVFGQTGQVAREIARRAPSRFDLTCLSRADADLRNPDHCAAVVRETACDAVLNLAAWTAVDAAEKDEPTAMLVNGTAPTAMAAAAADKHVPFLHVSTDYVFNGSGARAWSPTDATAPQSAYGRTKRAGEVGVATAGGHWLVLRTSWVFSVHGTNFVKTMLRLGAERDRLRIVADQIGGPTPAAAIADALLVAAEAMAGGASGGMHHFSGTADVSWADLARAVFAKAGRNVGVEDIQTVEYPTPARRPLNSRLNCDAFARAFGVERPAWPAYLDDVLQELGALA